MTQPASKLVDGLLPPTWPNRGAVLEVAAVVDEDLGEGALEALLAAWSAWRESRALPASRPLRALLQALGPVITGGLGPRPMPRAGAIA